jgi:hypothetical protein
MLREPISISQLPRQRCWRAIILRIAVRTQSSGSHAALPLLLLLLSSMVLLPTPIALAVTGYRRTSAHRVFVRQARHGRSAVAESGRGIYRRPLGASV